MVSSQIIDVINELCSKFGIAIDWSQKKRAALFGKSCGKSCKL